MLASNLSLNLVELGHFCAYLAMMVALLQGAAPIAALSPAGPPPTTSTSTSAMTGISRASSAIVFCAISVLPACVLVYCLLTGTLDLAASQVASISQKNVYNHCALAYFMESIYIRFVPWSRGS